MRLNFGVLHEIFRHRNFRRQYIARAVSFLGGSMSPIALSFAILGAGMSASDLGLRGRAVGTASAVRRSLG